MFFDSVVLTGWAVGWNGPNGDRRRSLPRWSNSFPSPRLGIWTCWSTASYFGTMCIPPFTVPPMPWHIPIPSRHWRNARHIYVICSKGNKMNCNIRRRMVRMMRTMKKSVPNVKVANNKSSMHNQYTRKILGNNVDDDNSNDASNEVNINKPSIPIP